MIKRSKEPVPTTLGRKPAWIAELQARRRRQKRRFAMVGLASLATTVAILILALPGKHSRQESASTTHHVDRASARPAPSPTPPPAKVPHIPKWASELLATDSLDAERSLAKCYYRHGAIETECRGASGYEDSKSEALAKAIESAQIATVLELSKERVDVLGGLIHVSVVERRKRAKTRQDLPPGAETLIQALPPAEIFWMEYAGDTGNEFRAFARYQLSPEQSRSLAEKLSRAPDAQP